MTGEMIKPEKADEIRDVEYWNKVGGVGDDGVCIYPNYPDHFDMMDKIKKIFPDTSIEAHDVYLGPKINIPCVGEVFMTGTEGVLEWNLTSRYFPEGNKTFNEDGLIEFLAKIRSIAMVDELDASNLTTGDIDIGKYKGIEFGCPNCGSTYFSVDNEDWEKEWVYAQYSCADCQFKYTGSYRLVELESTVTNLE